MDLNEIDFFLKLIPILIGALGVVPSLYGLVVGSKGHLRDEYKFAKEFLSDLEDTPGMHAYAKHKGLQALANDRSVQPGEVLFILTLPSPVQALRDFVLGHAYLELARFDQETRIQFRKKYQARWQRLWRKWYYSGGYILFAFLAYSPLFLAAPLHANLVQLTDLAPV